MSTPTYSKVPQDLEYPDSDGQPMADNTLQFRWIVTIECNLDALYANNANVFIAGDLLWYPVQEDPTLRAAPDVLAAFGRPKGYRGSYKQWKEGSIAPQVAFEILSTGNYAEQMDLKFEFYQRYGIEEYYVYNPYNCILWGWIRSGRKLVPIKKLDGWVSPLLGIRFDLSGEELVIYRPDGQHFLTFVELVAQKERAERLANEERRAKELAELLAERLAAQLRALGVEPHE